MNVKGLCVKKINVEVNMSDVIVMFNMISQNMGLICGIKEYYL